MTVAKPITGSNAATALQGSATTATRIHSTKPGVSPMPRNVVALNSIRS